MEPSGLEPIREGGTPSTASRGRASRRGSSLGFWAKAACFALVAASACAQDYPTKPIRVLVGNAAGGSTDWMARLATGELSASFPTGFVVDNRAGASGTIASNLVAKAAPDGYTLAVVGSTHSRVKALYPDVPYDPVSDFACMGMIAGGPYVLVVHPSLPVRTFPDLLAHLRKNPGTPYASSGAGTGQHMTMELLESSTGIRLTEVHFKGSAAMWPDLMAGRLALAFDNISLMLPFVKKGTLRAVAITDSQRFAEMPDVPTIAESGIPGFEVIGWFAVIAPVKTPKERLQIFNTALNAALKRPEVSGNLRKVGARPLIATPAQCDKTIAAETAKWSKVVAEAGIKP